MNIHRTAACGLLACVAFYLPVSAQPQPERVKTSGTVKGAAPGLLFVVSDQGDQFRVRIPARADYITFAGSADPSWLQPGMFVTFIGQFDQKGNPVAPIRDIQVFTPTKETPLGVAPDAGLSGGAKNLFSAVDATQAAPEGAHYKVAGRLSNVHRGKLTIQAGRVAVQVDLADNAKVSVNLHDLRFMSEGDTVSIEGLFLPQQRRDIVAERLTVSAAKTLGAKKPKPGE